VSRTASPPRRGGRRAGTVASNRAASAARSPSRPRNVTSCGAPATTGDDAASVLAAEGSSVSRSVNAGLGKTRILAELLAAMPGARVLAACGEVYDAATPYRSVRQLLHPVLGLDGGATAAELTAAVARLAPALAPWAPLIGVAAGIEVPETPEVAALDGRFRKVRLEAAVADLLAAAAPGVLVLVAEDLHLFDEASADVVRGIAAAAVSRPWLVLGTRRTAPDAPALAPAATRLELRPLSAAAAAELLDALTVAAPLPPHLHAAVLARAAGNPLFLRELVAGLRTAAVAARSGSTELLDSIEGVIAARIDRLAPPDRSLLRAAAVLGMTVDPDLLGELLGADAPAAAIAARLGASGLGGFLHPDAAGLLRFRQQLVRDTAYEGLPYRRRVLLHRRAGEAIRRASGEQGDDVADLLAVHFAAAELWPATWRYARIAGARARARYALAEAEAAYALAARAAEHLALADGEVVDVLEVLGDVRFECGDYRSADAAYGAARARIRDAPVALARLRLKTARACERSGRYPVALRWLSRARTGLGPADPGEPDAVAGARARVDAMYARVRRVQGRDREAVRWAEAALTAAERCGDLRTVAASLEVLDWADIGLGRLHAEPRILRALQIYTELGDVGAAAHMHNGLGARAYFRGRWSEAAEHYEQARAGFERVGDVPNTATAAANLAELLVEQNRLPEANEALAAAMRVWRAVGAVTDLAWGRHQLGRIAARAGRHDEALVHFGSAREDFEHHHEALEVLAVDASTAESQALAGRPRDALALAGHALRRASAVGGLVPALPQLHRARGLALMQQHDQAGAVLALRASLAAARAREARHEVALALTALLAHGLGGEDADAWCEERNRLVAELGIRNSSRGERCRERDSNPQVREDRCF
jgi:tetratricopeptide (TPR) repeat protein